MKKIFLLILVLTTSQLSAQTSDDFEDGNFTQNPEWTGDQQYFQVNASHQLQLNDVAENQAYIGTSNQMIVNTEWRCWIKLAFSPSSNNYARYYLVSDNQNLIEPLSGYFLQFGESGSDDAIELFRQDGADLVSVCRGSEGVISSSFELRVKVTRDEVGNWKLFVDKSGGEDFLLEAEGMDNTYSQTTRIGFVCKYTLSNSTKMYFDDVYAGPFIVDNDPPVLLSVATNSDSTTILQFNELLNEGSVANVVNYEVDNGIGNPVVAVRDEADPSQVKLAFNTKFEIGTQYSMQVSGVKDLAENTMETTVMEFSYYRPQPYDIVINEIMADPTPPVALPEYEYLELYNQTQSSIDMDGWKLIIGTSEKDFESVIIASGGFLILANEIAHDDFIAYGDFYGFGSFTLTNSGQTIELLSDNGETISKVSYSDNWYHDPEKEEGGWSIEQKNPANICSGGENWAASVDGRGGTPGSINSVANGHILLPQVSSLQVTANNILILYFNQSMDEESLSNNNAYSINGGIGEPTYIYTYLDEPKKVELYFDSPFAQGLSYQLTIRSSIMNCMQLNLVSDTIVTFGLPDIASTNDIVINEILFNPWTDGEDYVELFNRSNKIIDLSTLRIGSIKESPPNPPDTIIVGIVDQQTLMLPDEYIVLTISPDVVKKQYVTSNPDAFLLVDPFPSYNNDKGHLTILSYDEVIIDSLTYSEEMQFPLLNYYDGVALERINPNVNLSDNTNWHSAAESVGFGTPGYQNSQFVSNRDNTDEIVIDPEIFSPDNDGYEDLINIKYKFDTPGYVMSVTVYNAEGYQIKKLVNNEYLGTEGSVSWDGINDNNTKASVGIYVFYISVYDTEGNVKKYKKTGVLATKL